MQLGDRIRELRNNKRETLKEISEKTAISVSYLSDIERNRTRPSLQTLERLANYFKITVNDLLHGVELAGEISKITDKALPSGLVELFNDEEFKDELDEEWKKLLTKIELRGKRPQTKREWTELYLNLRRVLDSPNK